MDVKNNLLYLVAIPKGRLLYCGQKIQKYLWEKYNLGEVEVPEIHLTIDAFYYDREDDIEKIKESLQQILKKVGPFEIITNGFSYIPAPFNCITIHIVKTKELKNVFELIHRQMMEKKFLVREYHEDEIIFHISVAGIHGRQWSEEESMMAWDEVKDMKFQEHSMIDELQLWFPLLDPERKTIHTYKL
ncbi:MAG: 2'-5' RNA ligase family protein [Bacillota bacterium]